MYYKLSITNFVSFLLQKKEKKSNQSDNAKKIIKDERNDMETAVGKIMH